jgi:hypothetical protein
MKTHLFGFSLSLCALVTGVCAEPLAPPYRITSTQQSACYDDFHAIPCPALGQSFYGQNAQTNQVPARLSLASDGLTVQDTSTGLTWQRSPDINHDQQLTRADKLDWAQAQRRPAELNAAHFAGYSDWRLPSIKELYSLINFNGTDPAPNVLTAQLTPFIDTRYFAFAYGQTSQGERVIDAQYASSTLYVNSNWFNSKKLFGVNFADGRIKGYDLKMPGGSEKTFFVLCVRGNPAYGQNNFVASANDTVSDLATGLMWSRTDSGEGMNWQQALAWAQSKNAQAYLGYSDWRLPDAKELQSIVDYARSPDSSQSAAINPIFHTTAVTNEAGQTDYPAFWSSTTHASPYAGSNAVYLSFGRSLGLMRGVWQDVHGAGAQRSDPKAGNPAFYSSGRGPQGDAVHINNFVRLVRTITH